MLPVSVTNVVSRDGTPIACERVGSGPPLVLVSGAGSARVSFDAVVPLLAEHFTTYALDRRGWGWSGDADEYALEREFEDVASVVDAIGEPAFLLGHSIGGVFAFGGALLSDNVDKLVLYEGGALLAGLDSPSAERADEIEKLVRSGEKERAVIALLETGGHFSPEDIERIRDRPTWPDRVARASRLPRELRARVAFVPRPEDVRRFDRPILLLAGERSTKARVQMEQLARMLPNARLELLEGQRHAAMQTAPQLFASRVIAFLEAEVA